jgi:hypothetical protein
MMNNQFVKYRPRAVFSNVPISELDKFRKIYPGMYRLRYRGPRNTPVDLLRSPATRQSSCLKQNARTFSAYTY